MSGETRINAEWKVFQQLRQSGFVVPWIMVSISWNDLEAFCIILSPVWGVIVWKWLWSHSAWMVCAVHLALRRSLKMLYKLAQW